MAILIDGSLRCYLLHGEKDDRTIKEGHSHSIVEHTEHEDGMDTFRGTKECPSPERHHFGLLIDP